MDDYEETGLQYLQTEVRAGLKAEERMGEEE